MAPDTVNLKEQSEYLWKSQAVEEKNELDWRWFLDMNESI